MQELVFVTGNTEKIHEAKSILPFPFSSHVLDLDEIQSLDSEAIVRKKTEAAYNILHTPLFVDDAGLSIDAWRGFPGPLVKFIHTAGGPELLISMMSTQKNRLASFKGTIGYHDGTRIQFFHGELRGTIAKEIRGKDGWGFDPLFIPEGYTKTLSELGPEIKNKLSHRKKALTLFADFLKNTPPA